MEPYFIWKGQNSLDKNIMVTKLPPHERAEANIDKKIVPGRDGFLTENDGTFAEILKPCECVLDEGNIDDVVAWLTGTDEVTFSNEPDKKYIATIINKIPLVKVIPTLHEFVVQFDCQPYAYDRENALITLLTEDTVTNPGTRASKPIIKVYGIGDIALTIGFRNVYLDDVVDYVTLDSVIEDVYKDTVLKNNDWSGDFPVLQPGDNTISWVGNVTKIEITPNWRYL